MDWVKIAEAAIGTFTGGAIALGSMWIKEIIDRRKAAQVWYEQHYIAEGIDRLLSHVRLVNAQLALLISGRQTAVMLGTIDLHPGVEKPLKSEAHEAYPLEALVRLEILLKDDLITAIIISHGGNDRLQQMPAGSRSMAAMTSSFNRLRNLYDHLQTIRTELLKVKVKQKSDIEDIAKRPGIKQTLAALGKFNDEWLAKTMERDRLIASEK